MRKEEIEVCLPASYQNLAIIRNILRTYFDIERVSKADTTHLIAAVDELATNAIEHAYAGLDIAENDKLLQINLGKSNDIVHITVEDFGVGYSSLKKSKDEGGMGLNIVKGIVDKFEMIHKQNGLKVEISKTVKKEEE